MRLLYGSEKPEKIEFRLGVFKKNLQPQEGITMKLSPKKPINNHCGGFTLIELITVITIILVLAGITYPAARGVMNKARKTAVQNSATSLKNAITTYQVDYRRFPVEEYGTDQQYDSSHLVMDVLLGAEDNKLNPRGTSYFKDKSAKRNAEGEWASGVVLEADGSGELFDAWGEYFRIFLDLDGNSRIEAPSWAPGEVTTLAESVIIWSAGPDKEDDGVKKDNIAAF